MRLTIKRVLCLVLLCFLIFCSGAMLIAFKPVEHANAAKTNIWNDLEFWGGLGGFIPNSQKEKVGNSIVISTKKPGEMSSGYHGMPFALDGLKIKFVVEKTDNDGNLKFIFTPNEGWYNDNLSSFTIDFAHGKGNKATIQHSIKYPDGGTQISHPRAGRDCDFYWDGSKENVFEVKLESGILHFYINGTDLDSDPLYLDTQRLIDLGVLDFFIDGSAYFNLWHQSKSAIKLTFNEFIFTPATQQTELPKESGWANVDNSKLLCLANGVGQLQLLSEANNNYAVKYIRAPIKLSDSVVKLSLGVKTNEKYGIFFDAKNDAINNKQIRIYLTNIGRNKTKVEILTFDGANETKIGEAETASSFTSADNPDFSKITEVRIKKLTLEYQLFINNVLIPVKLSPLTDFVNRYFTDGQAYLVLSNMLGQSQVNFFRIKAISSFVAPQEWLKYGTDDGVVLALDEGKFQAYSTDNSGIFKIFNKKEILWNNAFGLKFNMDKLDKANTDAFRIVLSSEKNKFYAESNSPALFIDFAISEANSSSSSGYTTSISINNSQGQMFACAKIQQFNWDYFKANAVYFGKVDGSWVLEVNDRSISIKEANFQENINKYMQANFVDEKAYLQLENLGGKATSFSLISIHYGIPTSELPYGWVPGITTAPQWLVSGAQGEAAFTSSGQGYTLQNESHVAVPLEGFKMKLKMAPGSKNFNTSMVFNCGGSMWYNEAFGMGIYLAWGQETGYEKITVGVLLYKPDEVLKSNLIWTRTVEFKWFEENLFEFKKTKGTFGFYLNNENLFQSHKDDKGRTFDELFKIMSSRLQNNEADLQMYVDSGNETYVIKEINMFKKSFPPVQIPSEINMIETATYNVGKTITVDLAKVFFDNAGLPMTFTANKGEINGNIWTCTPDIEGEMCVTFCASNGKRESLPIEILFNVKNESSKGCSGSVKFLSEGWVMLLLVSTLFVVKKKRAK